MIRSKGEGLKPADENQYGSKSIFNSENLKKISIYSKIEYLKNFFNNNAHHSSLFFKAETVVVRIANQRNTSS